MGLASVAQTALSGMAAAEWIVAAAGNNLANAQTPGYKASYPVFATQTPQTYGAGAAPSDGSGGDNPVQTGAGVTVAGMETDFSQGPLVATDAGSQFAVEGEGMFILRGPDRETYYTRDGHFSVDANRELVASDGSRLLGWNADDQFRVDRTALVPLRIPAQRDVVAPDGSVASLIGYSVARDGRIEGRFSDGRARTLGQIATARFANPSGLRARAGTRFSEGPNSGLAVVAAPTENGAGPIVGGFQEQSNTDLARNLVNLGIGETMFRSNAAVLHTSVHLLDELINLRRLDG